MAKVINITKQVEAKPNKVQMKAESLSAKITRLGYKGAVSNQLEECLAEMKGYRIGKVK